MPKVVIPIREDILRSAERRKDSGAIPEVGEHLAELIDLGFKHRLEQLYRQFEEGRISLEYLANELGLGVRELYAALEKQGLPTSNIQRQGIGVVAH